MKDDDKLALNGYRLGIDGHRGPQIYLPGSLYVQVNNKGNRFRINEEEQI